MPKKLAVALMSAVAAVAMIFPVSSANAGTANVGTSACYLTVDYWEIDAEIKPTSPFVTVTPSGTVGAGVHCPLPPAPSVSDILRSISWN